MASSTSRSKTATSTAAGTADGPRSGKVIAIAVVATIALIALDLSTKAWAESTLSKALPGDPPPICAPDAYGLRRMQRMRGEPIVLVPDHVEFRYAENCGAAFGMFSTAPSWVRKSVFGLAAVAASIALFLMFIRGRGGVWFAWSVPLVVSGALGNLIDRFRFGYVVDFIRVFNLHLPGLNEWPTFNVADIGITVGVAFLVLDGFRQPRTTGAGEAMATTK